MGKAWRGQGARGFAGLGVRSRPCPRAGPAGSSPRGKGPERVRPSELGPGRSGGTWRKQAGSAFQVRGFGRLQADVQSVGAEAACTPSPRPQTALRGRGGAGGAHPAPGRARGDLTPRVSAAHEKLTPGYRLAAIWQRAIQSRTNFTFLNGIIKAKGNLCPVCVERLNWCKLKFPKRWDKL